MADDGDAKVSYPYMSANQWWGLRSRFKQVVPSTVTLDWIIGALDTTQKGAGNVLPQLRLLGLTNAENKPTDLVHDFKDDDTYAAACAEILNLAYPKSLRDAYSDPEAEPGRVASWFSRNAKTGAQASVQQAKLYLLILKGELPDPEDVKVKAPRKKAALKNGAAAKPRAAAAAEKDQTVVRETPPPPPDMPHRGTGPNLHIDLQIHISADAGEAQIESIFKSMAKHLYGK